MMRVLSVGLISLTLASCASIPKLPAEHQLRIADLIGAMECEMADLVMPSNPTPRSKALAHWLRDRRYTSVFKVVVTDQNVFAGDLSLTVPVTVGSTIVGLGGGLDFSDKRTVEINLSNEFKKVRCERPDLPDGGDWKLGGTIGLEDWLQQAWLETLGISSRVGTIAHNLEFTIKANHSIAPRFTVIPANLTGAGINPSWKGSRSDVHTLAIEVARIPGVTIGSAAKKPLFVSVVGGVTTATLAAQLEKLKAVLESIDRETGEAQDKRDQTAEKLRSENFTSGEEQELRDKVKKADRFINEVAPARRNQAMDSFFSQQSEAIKAQRLPRSLPDQALEDIFFEDRVRDSIRGIRAVDQ